MKLGLILWLSTCVFYKKKIYPKDKLYLNYAFFVVGSYFASTGYTSYLLEDRNIAAALLNNERE
jgi:hypothetical protein